MTIGQLLSWVFQFLDSLDILAPITGAFTIIIMMYLGMALVGMIRGR